MFGNKREEQYLKEIRELQLQLNEKNQLIEQMLQREQQLLQENLNNNTQTLKMLEIVLEKLSR